MSYSKGELRTMDRLTQWKSQYHLAVSLHAPNDALRSKLVPVNKKIGLQKVLEAADRYFPLALGTEGSCQIGGNLATNAGGLNAVRYGVARDLVLGTILEAMSRIMTKPVSRAYTDGVARAILSGLGLDVTRTDQLLRTPIPRLRRPAQRVCVKEPSTRR